MSKKKEEIKIEFTERQLREIKVALMGERLKTMQLPFRDAETKEIMDTIWDCLEKIAEHIE